MRYIAGIVLVIIMLFALGMGGDAQAQGGYELTQGAVVGGGGSGVGGGYTLSATLGQPLAGVESSGSSYTLTGGLLGIGGIVPVPTAARPRVLLPLVRR